ncbi:DUF4112 domain-containing protein [Propionibacteriaceae bacterium Y2011]|uniref:DUF4112 domain-containing protein n=1 Tax=Microlunatus sp. Y2014 TaxID=3418488 RepID=UPI003B47F15E
MSPDDPGDPGPGDPRLRRTRTIARFMDDLVTIPGTKIGIGLDSLIGLFPGVGDAAGTVLSTTILVEAVRARVPIPMLLRMCLNLLLDTALGWIPFAGDLADVAFRANRMNARLLADHLSSGSRSDVSTKGYLLKAVIIVALLVLIMVASVVAMVIVLLTVLNPFGS